MINFIFGRRGSGKSAKLKDILEGTLDSGDNIIPKIILLVPEQSSFENEKNMLERLGNIKFNKIKVLSFSRLFDFTSQTLKIPNISTINDTTHIILMNAAIQAVHKNLKLYSQSCRSIDLAALMLKTFQEFKSNKISGEILDKISGRCSNALIKQKISEIKLIAETYSKITKNKFKDSFDSLDILESILNNNQVFENYSIFIDEFGSFTAQQLSIIEIMIKQCKNIHITFCTDGNAHCTGGSKLFFHINKAAEFIKSIAEKNHIKTQSIFLEDNFKAKNEELRKLEKNLFLAKKIPSNIDAKNIKIYHGANLNEECEHIALNIRRLIIESNFKYSDTAVLTRDIGKYSGALESVFKKYEIPYFLDAPEKIFNKNLTNLILSAFEAVHSNYQTGSIIRFLKSGLTDISSEESALIENYARLWSIKGKQWLCDFTRHPEGLSKKSEEKNIAELYEINRIRKLVIKPLENFRESILKSTGEGISKAIYNLLEEVNAAENFRNSCVKLMANDKNQIAQEQHKLWDAIMDILSQMAQLLNSTPINSRCYAEILESAMNSADIASIPRCADRVIIGSLERTRLPSIKAVFIPGAVNGEFPKTPDDLGIFTDSELKSISEMKIEIKDSSETVIIKERFLAYFSLTASSELLFISWPSFDNTGKVLMPSEIIKEVKEIFPNLKIHNKNNFNEEELIWAEKPAFEVLAQNWNKNSELESALKSYFYNHQKYKDKCRTIEKLAKKEEFNFKNPDTAKKLFGEHITLSASQIEKYYTCRFGYFCQYALEAKLQEPAEFGGLEYGNLVHFTLEKLFKKYPQSMIIDIPSATLKTEINNIAEKYVAERLGGLNNKPPKFEYFMHRFKESMFFLIQRFAQEFKQSEFTLTELEAEVSEKGSIKPLKFKLSDGTLVEVEGKIDRIDIMKKNNITYVRIIDYKTGTKEFKLSDLLYGLNMQTLIYLTAISKNGYTKCENPVPAGALYFPAIKPTIDSENIKNELKIEEKISKKLKMNGMVLDNIEVVRGMDKGGEGKFIPISIKNDEIKKSQSLFNLQQLGSISHHIEKLTIEMAENLRGGMVSPTPIFKKYTACKWCCYFPVCRYEDNKFIKVPGSMPAEEVFKKMEESKE